MIPSLDATTINQVANLPTLALKIPDFPSIFDNVDFNIVSIAPPTFPTIISTIALVTASDMIPFIPCQPLAITLGSQMGIYALPICIIGQTTAGVLAFRASRLAADSNEVQRLLDSLDEETRLQFENFRKLGSTDITADDKDQLQGEFKVLLALIGLRLAPFFPFSAGNYLLGGATGVGLRPFFIATVFGCILSNSLSVGVGMGGVEVFQHLILS